MMDQFEEAKSENQLAIDANNYLMEAGLSRREIVTRYATVSQQYDKVLGKDIYKGPDVAATEIASRFRQDQRQYVSIIDIAAGTGKVGLELNAKGFKKIDALEPCKELLNILTETEVYTNKYEEFLGKEQTSILADNYDVLVTSGAMGPSHIPVEGLDEFIRITKPGGLVVIVMREEFLRTAECYKGKLESYMNLLEKKNLWKKEKKMIIPNYSIGKDGVVFIYKIL